MAQNTSQGKTNTMSAINTNVTSLVAQNALRQNNISLQTSLTRLSTGLKINTGADDPAGLIAANDLKDQQAGINQAISNAQRANNVIGTAAGGLTEVSSLLTQLQSLVSQTANSGGLSQSAAG
jgi:flagellin